MKPKVNIINISLHVLFWVITSYFFINYSLLRPSSPTAVYREYFCLGAIISMVYLNYFVLIPRFFCKGRFVIYWILTALSILMVAVTEYLLFKPVIMHLHQAHISEEVLNKYLNVQFLLYFVRAVCFFMLFFTVKLYQDISSRYIAETQVIANDTQVVAVIKSDDDIKTIKISAIAYLSHHNRNTYFHLTTGEKYYQRASLKQIEALLPNNSYLRINKNNVVMYSQIDGYNDSFVFLKPVKDENPIELHITNEHKDDILSELKKYKNSLANILDIGNIKNVDGNVKNKNGIIKKQNGIIKSSNIINLTLENQEKNADFSEKTLENEIFEYISAHPNCKTSDILAMSDKSRRTVDRNLKNLREKGLIRYKGANKTGGYYVTQKRKRQPPQT
jgi:hypothetical protein